MLYNYHEFNTLLANETLMMMSVIKQSAQPDWVDSLFTVKIANKSWPVASSSKDNLDLQIHPDPDQLKVAVAKDYCYMLT